jgi:hypothetical protein
MLTPEGNQTWKEQTQSHQRCQASHRCQNYVYLSAFAIFSGCTSKFSPFLQHCYYIRKGWIQRSLLKEALDAFCILKNSLISEPVMACPRADRQYVLITDATTGNADTCDPKALALSCCKKTNDNFYAISYKSC